MAGSIGGIVLDQPLDTTKTPRPTHRLSEADALEGRVLFIGNNADIQKVVERSLASRYDLRHVSDSAGAVEELRRHRPDVVLAEVTALDVDRLELVDEIRADPDLKTLAVILIVSSDEVDARAKGLERGADDCLVVPFSVRELTASVTAQIMKQRRQSDEALRLRTEQLVSLLDPAPIGIYIVDSDFRLRDVNPVALPTFGKVRGGIVGRDFETVIRIQWEKEYADEIVRVFRHTLETGEPHVAPERAELRIDRGVTEYYEWRLARITLPDGRYGVVCYFREISAQVLARLAIAESEEHRRRTAEGLRAVAARAHCLLWYGEVEDRGGPGLAWTLRMADEEAARRFLPIDLPPSHSYGRALADARLAEDRARMAWGDHEARAGRSYRQEYRIRDAGGNIRWLSEDVQIETIAPKRWYAVGITIDITERKQAEEDREKHLAEIETLNHRLRRAMQETHHRVKNNLQVIAAMVDLQVMEDHEQVPLSELRRLNMHIRALAAIHDLLTLDGKRDPLLGVMSAREGIEKTLAMLEAMSSGKRFVRHLQEIDVPLRQGASLAILVNELVMNAVKHGCNLVEVTLTCSEGRARLEVSDDGPGFPPGFDAATAANTGLDLVENVARWDLGGETSYENRTAGGARVVVQFSLTKSDVLPGNPVP